MRVHEHSTVKRPNIGNNVKLRFTTIKSTIGFFSFFRAKAKFFAPVGAPLE